MSKNDITCADIELALVSHFHARRNFVIPNVSWGWRNLLYEVDVVVVTASGYAYDIEIKVSAGDLRRDHKKHKWGYCLNQHNFRKSYFAMPEPLLKYEDLVPANAGVLAVTYDRRRHWFDVEEARPAVVDGLAKPVTDAEISQLGRLCMLRMWDLKRALWQSQRLEAPDAGKDGEG